MHVTESDWSRHSIKMHCKQLPAIRLNYPKISEALVWLSLIGCVAIGKSQQTISVRLLSQLCIQINETNHKQTWKTYNVNIGLFHTFFSCLKFWYPYIQRNKHNDTHTQSEREKERDSWKSIVLPLLVSVFVR